MPISHLPPPQPLCQLAIIPIPISHHHAYWPLYLLAFCPAFATSKLFRLVCIYFLKSFCWISPVCLIWMEYWKIFHEFIPLKFISKFLVCFIQSCRQTNMSLWLQILKCTIFEILLQFQTNFESTFGDREIGFNLVKINWTCSTGN